MLSNVGLQLAVLAESVDVDDRRAGAAARLAQASFDGAVCLESMLSAGGAIYATDVPIHLLRPCAGCPVVGCTTYCTDRYVRAIGSTTVLGITVVRWDVRTTVKKVCCCYKGLWDRFWAINCCHKTVTITGPTKSVLRKTYIGAPPKAPFSVVRLC